MLKRLLLYLIVIELVLVGGGQMIHVTSFLTLRMCLWIAAIVVSIGNKHLPSEVCSLMVLFCITLLISGITGLLFGNFDYLIEDIKPLSYFFIVVFFVQVINSHRIIEKIESIFKWTTLTMTVVYFVFCALILVGYLNYFILQPILPIDDFFFRNEEGFFFYKGFVFMPIGLLFFLKGSRLKYIWVTITLIAIFFTYTRGFYIVAFLALFLNQTVNKSLKKYFWALILAFIAIYVALSMGVMELFSDRAEESNGTRIVTFYQVLERINPLSFMFGYGLGNGVPIRPGHFECSYLEIFHKQGLLGLAFWMKLFDLIRKKYSSLSYIDREELKPFYIGVLLIYIQSIFNPYLNNPIGMGFVLLTLVIFLYKSRIRAAV